MENEFERRRDEIEFALKLITEVAERRKHSAMLARCGDLLSKLRTTSASPMHRSIKTGTRVRLQEICSKADLVADELAILTSIEIREVLFPLPEIKRATREFGSRFSENYFEWLAADHLYSPEELMRILEEDLAKLEIARELLSEHE